MRLSISKAAALSGVSVRTLQYYDKIGLFSPSEVMENGYRYYEEESMEQLQQILFYRELNFSLKEIKNILSAPDYKKEEAFSMQLKLLTLERDRLNDLIGLLKEKMEGNKDMTFEAFDRKSIDEQKEKYQEEVKERWGTTKAFEESQKKVESYDKEDWAAISAKMEGIMDEFAAIREVKPDCEEAKRLVRKWQQFITDHYYECTDEILKGLGQMYTADERFTENIDKHGAGTAAFMSKAIAAMFE